MCSSDLGEDFRELSKEKHDIYTKKINSIFKKSITNINITNIKKIFDEIPLKLSLVIEKTNDDNFLVIIDDTLAYDFENTTQIKGVLIENFEETNMIKDINYYTKKLDLIKKFVVEVNLKSRIDIAHIGKLYTLEEILKTKEEKIIHPTEEVVSKKHFERLISYAYLNKDTLFESLDFLTRYSSSPIEIENVDVDNNHYLYIRIFMTIK